MSEELKPDIALLRKAVEWVEVQDKLPEIDRDWEQGAWITNPRNKAINLLFGEEDEYEVREALANQLEPYCGTAYCVAGYIGQMLDERYREADKVNGVHVSDFATKALGLSEYQADQLFSGGNTAEDVRRIAEEIAGERL